MKMKKRHLLAGLLLWAGAAVSAGNFSAVDSLLMGKISEGSVGGAIALVARDGEIRHFRPYGQMDVGRALPMDRSAIIPIASMTKVVTSIGVLILQQEGKLDIDDPVENYLPQFRNISVRGEALVTKPTVRHLLAHTAGLEYGNAAYSEAGFPEWNGTLSEFVDRITDMPLAFQPGTAWKYSYCHDILGLLIEEVSGTSLDRFLKAKIFLPLGMTDTDFYVPAEKVQRQSALYRYENDDLITLDREKYHSLPNALSGGGGWFDSYSGALSTVGDYYLLAEWLLTHGATAPGVLDAALIRLMISNQTGELKAHKSYDYGLGVGVIENEAGETREIFWSGSPYNTYFWVDYQQHEIGILFTNTAPPRHALMDEFKAAVTADTKK